MKITIKTFGAMMCFGLLMGLAFPVYASFFCGIQARNEAILTEILTVIQEEKAFAKHLTELKERKIR